MDELLSSRSQRFEKGSRYYQLVLEKDLLGDWVITKVHGRKGTKLGAIRREAFESKKSAQDAFSALQGYRMFKRHYRKVPSVF